GCSPGGVRRVRADFRRVVQEWHRAPGAAQDVREIRRLMARRASRLVAKEPLPAFRGLLVEASFRRIRNPQTQLVVEQCPKLRGDEIGGLRDEETEAGI